MIIGIGLILLVGIILGVIYAVGLRYTYDKGQAAGQSYQGASSTGTGTAGSGNSGNVGVYDTPRR